MTISFMRQWADGTPTYFVEKILGGLMDTNIDLVNGWFLQEHGIILNQSEKLVELFAGFEYELDYHYMIQVYTGEKCAKIHTIRGGKRDYRQGIPLHLVIGEQTPLRFQFAPTLECVSVQKFVCDHHNSELGINDEPYRLFVDDTEIDEYEEFAQFDGFDSADDLSRFMEHEKEYKLIHWTDKTY